MIFEKKKIQIETLSEYLTEVRLNLNMSSQEVADKTSIKIEFLNALEAGKFKILPADVYVFGFLRQLSAIYLINSTVLIEQYKKERGIQQQVIKTDEDFVGRWYKKYFRKLVITPKILTLIFGLAFVVISICYIIWQVWSINKTPSLNVSQPLNNAAIEGSSVQVKGNTDVGMSVMVNNQNIFVDSSGNFQTQLGLSPGPAEIVIAATNRFGKSVNQTINITGEATSSVPNSQLQLKVNFSGPVTLGFYIDDEPEQTLTFSKGDSKTFTASQKIVLSTTDGGATSIILNGQSLGAMGRPGEALNNVPFLAQITSTTTP